MYLSACYKDRSMQFFSKTLSLTKYYDKIDPNMYSNQILIFQVEIFPFLPYYFLDKFKKIVKNHNKSLKCTNLCVHFYIDQKIKRMFNFS